MPAYISCYKSLLTSCNRQVCYQEADNTLVINMLAGCVHKAYDTFLSNKSRGAPDSDLFYPDTG